jgi:hypothetical protein
VRGRLNTEKDFWARVCKIPGGCWQWLGRADRNGYARFILGGKSDLVHRWAWKFKKGPLPGKASGQGLDHTCRNRLCVRISHLELVTSRENNLRGMGVPALNARKTHCKRGHPLTDSNLGLVSGVGRFCRTCAKIHQRNFVARHPEKREQYNRKWREKQKSSQ